MNSKPTILFLSRARLDLFYRDIILKVKNELNVVVSAEEENMSTYSDIDGITVLRRMSLEDIKSYVENVGDSILSTIPDIEREIGLNCYASNDNYLLYRKYASRYGVSKSHEYMNTHTAYQYALYYKTLRKAVDEYGVDYCFFETMDTVDSAILWAMSEKGIIKRCFERILVSLGEDLRVRIASGKRRRSPNIDYIYENGLFNEASLARSEKLVTALGSGHLESSYSILHQKKASVLPKYSLDQLRIKACNVLRGESFYPAIVRLKNRLQSARYFDSEITSDKNIAYFLQVTPEASINSECPEFSDQEYIIEQIALKGRYGYDVLVKEHPAAYGNRPAHFYRELSYLPNVKLLPPSFPVDEILRKSMAVVVVSGTSVGVEAMLKGIPLVTVSNPFFDTYGGVYNVKRPEYIWDIIDDLRVDREDLVKYVASVYEGTFPHPPNYSEKGYDRGEELVDPLSEALLGEISLIEKGVF